MVLVVDIDCGNTLATSSTCRVALNPAFWVKTESVVNSSLCTLITRRSVQGVPLNQGNLASSLANIIATYELTPEDKSLVVMPLFHVHGLMAGQIPHPCWHNLDITGVAAHAECEPCMTCLPSPTLLK